MGLRPSRDARSRRRGYLRACAPAHASSTNDSECLDAVVGGKPTMLGRVTVDYLMTPAQTVYEIPLNGAEVAELAVDIWNSGPTAGHGSYVPDVSNVVIPV